MYYQKKMINLCYQNVLTGSGKLRKGLQMVKHPREGCDCGSVLTRLSLHLTSTRHTADGNVFTSILWVFVIGALFVAGRLSFS